LAVKNQSFFTLKFDSHRIIKSKNNLEIDLYNARRNNEVIRVGDCALFREIRRVKNIEFSAENLQKLEKNKKKLLKKTNNSENREEIIRLDALIDEILYIPEIITVKFSDVRHYKKIIDNNGFIINGKRFKRLLCSAGHARRSTVWFAAEEIYNDLINFLECGRDLNYEVNPNKFNSYFALATSGTTPVSRCNFVVVPDYILNKPVTLDYFVPNEEEKTDPTFDVRNTIEENNVFDGQGLISPNQAQAWSEELEIDWIPSAFIFRGAWMKGLLVTFDFHALAQQEGIKKIFDIYGVEHWVDSIEIIFSESQFKMAGGYGSLDEYNDACKRHHFGWGVTRYTPQTDKIMATTTYQYLQALDIEDEKIPEICKDTVDWLKDVSGLSWEKAVLFLIGENRLSEISKDWINRFQDPMIKSLIYEPKLINDSHIKKHLLRIMNKKIRESYTGVLNVDGNYEFVVNDPYAQAQHAFGLPVTGLLKENEFYSNYWNKEGVEKVSCFRSPMTWRSEHLVLNLVNSEELKKWYEYQYSNIIFNIFGNDLVRLSGADVDGDIVMTTPSFIDCHFEDYNIPAYERKTAGKEIINHDKLWIADTLSFGSKIGLVTNFGTTLFALLSSCEIGSAEYNLVLNRLKTCNVLQSCQIDKTKGIAVYDIPDWWDKWNKDGEPEKDNLYNSILCRQRPYFMRYVYPQTYGKKYKKHLEVYNSISSMRHKVHFRELINKKNKSEDEKQLIDDFYHYSPLLETDSIMNNICRYMEKEVKEIKVSVRDRSKFDHKVLMSYDAKIDQSDIDKMTDIYRYYNSYRRSKYDGIYDTETSEQFYIELKKDAFRKISNNGNELANLAVEICYHVFHNASKDFAWKLFGQEIFENIIANKMGFFEIPVLNDGGDIKYLNKSYKMTRIDIDDNRIDEY